MICASWYLLCMQMFQSHPAQQTCGEDEQFPSACIPAEAGEEDPVSSVNERQFEGTRESTGVASSPAVVGGGGLEAGEISASGAELGEATPRMPPPPPPPLSSQPLPFPSHGGYSSQQQTGGGADTSFTTASAEAAAINTGGVNPGFSTNLPAPPIPPPTFNPYGAFHSPMSHPVYGNAQPLGSSFEPANYDFLGRFSDSPLLRPNHLPGYPYRSPMRYPHHYRIPQWGNHHSPPSAAVFGGPSRGPPSQFAPSFPPRSHHGVPPYPPPPPLLQPLPSLAHPLSFRHHPHSRLPPLPPPPHFPVEPPPSFSTSLGNASGMGNMRPTTLLPSQLHGDHFSKVGDLHVFHSPSAITASSLQVQPPSSPPSVPSVDLQPSTTNQNNCNATNVAVPNLAAESSSGMAASLTNPTTLGGTTLQLPSFPLVGGTKSTPTLAQASYTAPGLETSVSMGPGGSISFPTLFQSSDTTKAGGSLTQKGYNFGRLEAGAMPATVGCGVEGVKQGAGSGSRLEVGDEESVSSLPVSIPEELRFVLHSVACMAGTVTLMRCVEVLTH